MSTAAKNLICKVTVSGVVMEGHEQLGAQQAVTSLLGAHIQPFTLLEFAHTQIHHASIHLHITSCSLGSRFFNIELVIKYANVHTSMKTHDMPKLATCHQQRIYQLDSASCIYATDNCVCCEA